MLCSSDVLFEKLVNRSFVLKRNRNRVRSLSNKRELSPDLEH